MDHGKAIKHCTLGKNTGKRVDGFVGVCVWGGAVKSNKASGHQRHSVNRSYLSDAVVRHY